MSLLDKVVGVVNEAYSDDNAVADSYKSGKSEGDSLALFVVQELQSVYSDEADEDDNLYEMRSAISRAIEQLERVRDALDEVAPDDDDEP